LLRHAQSLQQSLTNRTASMSAVAGHPDPCSVDQRDEQLDSTFPLLHEIGDVAVARRCASCLGPSHRIPGPCSLRCAVAPTPVRTWSCPKRSSYRNSSLTRLPTVPHPFTVHGARTHGVRVESR
jgi:hypothetical protein